MTHTQGKWKQSKANEESCALAAKISFKLADAMLKERIKYDSPESIADAMLKERSK